MMDLFYVRYDDRCSSRVFSYTRFHDHDLKDKVTDIFYGICCGKALYKLKFQNHIINFIYISKGLKCLLRKTLPMLNADVGVGVHIYVKHFKSVYFLKQTMHFVHI